MILIETAPRSPLPSLSTTHPGLATITSIARSTILGWQICTYGYRTGICGVATAPEAALRPFASGEALAPAALLLCASRTCHFRPVAFETLAMDGDTRRLTW